MTAAYEFAAVEVDASTMDRRDTRMGYWTSDDPAHEVDKWFAFYRRYHPCVRILRKCVDHDWVQIRPFVANK